MTFQGQTAFVTGGTTGIGRAIALGLAQKGAHVLFTGIGDDHANSLLEEIEKTNGSGSFIPGDLSTKDGWKSLWENVQTKEQQIGLFVHSASPPRPESQHVMAVTEDQWDSMVNTNLRTGFFLTRAVGEHMLENNIAGRIVMIVSLHSYAPRNLPHYSASKAGQVMLVKEFARCWAKRNIRVNGIAPGAIAGGGFKADVSTLEKKIAMGRTGVAEDLVGPALSLLHDDHSRYVTGSILNVDGGIALYNWLDAHQS